MKPSPRPRLKVVCMCRGGNVRSVALKQILRRYLDHAALACGRDTEDDDTRRLLFEWADKIVVLHHNLLDGVPAEFEKKLLVYHVGNDIWGNPFDEDLQERLVRIVNAEGHFLFGRLVSPDRVIQRLRDYRVKIQSRNVEDSAA